MPYTYTEREQELEPQASSARWGGPPRKSTLIGVLDPPTPPKRPIGPLSRIPISIVLRIFAAILLMAILAGLALTFFGGH
jgi:hypothetical protein